MDIAQRQHTQKHLRIVRGMLGELDAKRTFLRRKLVQNPLEATNIAKDLGALEGQFDAIISILDFIEQWPATCISVSQSPACR